MTDPLRAYADFYETLSPGSLDALPELVAPEVHFADPFNRVQGIAAMRGIFEDMFERIRNPRFRITSMARDLEDPQLCYLRWEMSMDGNDGAPLSFEGVSEVRFGDDGKVISHIDHWDPARQLYERVPVLGFVLRQVRRRLEVRV